MQHCRKCKQEGRGKVSMKPIKEASGSRKIGIIRARGYKCPRGHVQYN